MTIEADVRWLRDRAEISELLHAFARALDEQDSAAYAANFVPEGILEFPEARVHGQAAIAAHVASVFRPDVVRATHHISANHQITIDGDVAATRSYFVAVHVRPGGDPEDMWTGAGWYDNSYARTAEGWRFTHVRLTPVWRSGRVPGAIASGRFDG
jgi:ketosteroid isomerase-like protein